MGVRMGRKLLVQVSNIVISHEVDDIPVASFGGKIE
jgi:hypothetical protein